MYRCKHCGAEVVKLAVPEILIKMGICPTCYQKLYGGEK